MLKPKLKVLEGPIPQRTIELPEEGEIVIGRDRKCAISVLSRRVSREHVKFKCAKGNISIEDLNSKTGTFVNDKKVGSTPLRQNDTIKFGDVVIRFVVEREQTPEPGKAAPKPVIPPPVVAPPIVLSPKAPPSASASESTPPTAAERLREPSPSEISMPPLSAAELQIVGQTIAGAKIIAGITKGRRTLIYKGIQSARNRVVAVKFLNPEAERNPDIVRWFINGTKQSAELKHEDTLTPLGGGRQGDFLFNFSVFLEKGNAKDVFANARERGLAGVKLALETLVPIARALEFAAGRGLLHLGLRPTKILYDEKYRPKLIGLGFDNSPGAPGAETTSDVAAYLAPEQVTGSAAVSVATDIFSLGATFYYMLTGSRPSRDHRQRIPSPKRESAIVPDSICRIVEKMLATDPAQRYSAYGPLIHDVRWAIRGEAWPKT